MLILIFLALALLGIWVQRLLDKAVFFLADTSDDLLVELDGVFGAILDKSISVLFKALLLELFPMVLELVHGLEDLRLLLLSELSILTHEVDTHDKFAQLSDDRRKRDIGPLSDLGNELSASSLGLTLSIGLLLFERVLLVCDAVRLLIVLRQLVEALLQAAHRKS